MNSLAEAKAATITTRLENIRNRRSYVGAVHKNSGIHSNWRTGRSQISTSFPDCRLCVRAAFAIRLTNCFPCFATQIPEGVILSDVVKSLPKEVCINWFSFAMNHFKWINLLVHLNMMTCIRCDSQQRHVSRMLESGLMVFQHLHLPYTDTHARKFSIVSYLSLYCTTG